VTSHRPHRVVPRLLPLLLPSLIVALPEASSAGNPAAARPLSEDCFAELESGQSDEIACFFPLAPSPKERDELEKGSRGYVKDFSCRLTIRIKRAEIDKALAASDYTFKSPAQPVVCTITTHKSTFDVTGTFQPEVTFKNGQAVSATPGLGNVKGITRVISWPVVMFVNRWPSVRAGMVQIINGYKDYLARKKMSAPASPPP
jgi:hypothetical protein